MYLHKRPFINFSPPLLLLAIAIFKMIFFSPPVFFSVGLCILAFKSGYCSFIFHSILLHTLIASQLVPHLFGSATIHKGAVFLVQVLDLLQVAQERQNRGLHLVSGPGAYTGHQGHSDIDLPRMWLFSEDLQCPPVQDPQASMTGFVGVFSRSSL